MELEVPVRRRMEIGGFLTNRENHPLHLVGAMFQTQKVPVSRLMEIEGFLTSRVNRLLQKVPVIFQTQVVP
jgi:hypothetical protein